MDHLQTNQETIGSGGNMVLEEGVEDTMDREKY